MGLVEQRGMSLATFPVLKRREGRSATSGRPACAPAQDSVVGGRAPSQPPSDSGPRRGTQRGPWPSNALTGGRTWLMPGRVHLQTRHLPAATGNSSQRALAARSPGLFEKTTTHTTPTADSTAAATAPRHTKRVVTMLLPSWRSLQCGSNPTLAAEWEGRGNAKLDHEKGVQRRAV